MNIIKKTTLTCIALFFCIGLRAQIAGTFYIPSDFPTIAAAVNTLNILGVAGPVTINVVAGYTETAIAGGYKLNTVTGASASSQIIFRKDGSGANPLIQAYTGTATPVSAVIDAVWVLQGADYITIDGIDINDPNTSGVSMMELGIGLYKGSATNGCQYNTIKNCVITLNRSNGPNGINVFNNTFTGGSLLTVTTTAGTNSYNKFYSNTILNCNTGIFFYGYDGNTPGSTSDQFNDVGGTSAATGNTITNFGGGNGPAYAINTYWQYSFNASYNVINNNNGSGVSHANDLYAINSGGNAVNANVTLNSNTITLSSTRTGTDALTGIMNNAGGAFSSSASNTININNNVIAGYSYPASGTSTPGAVPGCSLICNKANFSVANINGNLINNMSVGNGTFNVISHETSYICSASANTITNIQSNGYGRLMMIRYASPYYPNVDNNVMDNISWTNTSNGYNGLLYCIYAGGTRTQGSISNNRLSNISLIGNNPPSFYGIYEGGIATSKTISGNQIYNVNAITDAGIGFIGIWSDNSSAGNSAVSTISANAIYSITQTSSANVMNYASIYGIQTSGSGRFNIKNNTLHSFSTPAYDVNIQGISVTSATNAIYNNVIGDFNSPRSYEWNGITGILLNSPVNQVYYNSVYLNAANTTTSFGSAAVYNINPGTLDLRNNILVNTSATGSAGTSAVLKRDATNLTSYLSTSNNNLMYAGPPASNVAIYYDGTNTYSTIAAFKTLVSPRDAQSFSENPPFVTTNGMLPAFLTINPSVATQVEGGALPISGYTNDYNGTVRNATTPDVGAFEGSYTQQDVFAPAIVSSGFTSGACSTTARTFTVALSDASGVASGSLSPRIYYRVNFSLYTSTAGTLTAGTATSGVWTFSLSYSASPGDAINYFIVAQDQGPLANLMITPSAGASGSNVLSVSVPPSPSSSYTISSTQLSGSYNVGSAGTYTTLTAAANAYNNSCLTGPVTFVLTNTLYATAETFPIVFQNNTAASATNSLLIQPATGTAVNFTGTGTTSSVLKFLNARYITVDGLNTAGSSLTLSNPNTGAAGVVWLASNVSGNSNIGIKRLTLNGNNISTAQSAGIFASADNSSFSLGAGADNDNIVIDGNTILRTYYGVYAFGTASVSAGGNDNWQITNNNLGPVVSGINNLTGSGIQLQSAVGATIATNKINNITTSLAAIGGVYISGFSTGIAIAQNTITNIAASYSPVTGVYLGPQTLNSSVTGNRISSVSHGSITGLSARGISINTGDAASNVRVENNMISDIYSYGIDLVSFWPAGISVEGTSGGINIDNNTVYLSGQHAGATASPLLASAAFLMSSTGTNINVRNNIFANSYDFTGTAIDKNYSMYSTAAASAFSAINNNAYYAGGTASIPVPAFLSSDLTSLSAIQTGFGGNLNSVLTQPLFVSATDLHLMPVNSNSAIDNAGAPVAGITTDIDNQTRNISTPDIGADEFSVPACTVATSNTIIPASYTLCAGQSIVLQSSGAGTDANLTYQWKASPVSGSSYTSVSGGSGATGTSYTTAPLPAGTYYMVLNTTCTFTGSGSMTAASNEATVVVTAPPTASATISPATVCAAGSFTLNAGSNTANAYLWTGPNGFISAAQITVVANAQTNATGAYTLVTSLNGCFAASAIVSATVTPSPTISISGNNTICSGQSTTLIAAGATSYTWNTLATTGSIVISPTTTTVYSVTGTNSNGCQSTKTISVVSNPLPVVSISPSPAAVCYSTAITLTASGASTYTWASGAVNPTISVTPVSATVYTVTGTNAAGCSSSATSAVSVYSLPVISITPSSATVCALSAVSFTAGGVSTYTWSGNTAGASASYIPFANAVYTVSGSSAQGCVTTATVAVTTNSLPVLYFSPLTPTVCNQSTVSLSVSGAASYIWNTGAQTSSVLVSPSVSTIYTVSGTNAAGCTRSGTVSLTVLALPVIQIAPATATVCYSTSTSFTASGASSYTWDAGHTSDTIFVTPTASTTYTVRGTNSYGCASSASIAVTVNPLPVLSVSPSSPSTCNQSSVLITASGATSYTWNATVFTNSFNVSPSVNTNYTVTGADANGCKAETVTEVTVFSLPVIGISPDFKTTCLAEPVTFTASGAATYTWIPDNVHTDVFSATPLTSTIYTVAGTSAEGCTSTALAAVEVVHCTGLQQQSSGVNRITVFPNPSNGLVTTQFELDGEKTIYITNSVGQLIHQATTSDTFKTFDLTGFAKGVYFITISTPQTSGNYKLIIN